MLLKRPNTFYIYLAFLTFTVIAYWQVAFLQNSLKWDMLGCYLPWRFHVGECIYNGVFPFWNPYTHLGNPIHADLRSVWYPETFIIGLTTGYSVLTLHLLFIVHLSLAGLGMYLLTKHFTDDWRAGFLAGAAYLLSGFFTGHGQEMFGIIAATWIPFVLYYFIRLQVKRNLSDVFRTTLFAFLLITGGYQAMWAIMLYLLISIFLAYFIRYFRDGQRKEAWQQLRFNVILALLTGLSLAVIVITFVQVSPHLSRLNGVSLDDAWFMPFSPQSCISFLVPFSTVKDIAWYNTDISMNNAYIGLVMLIFFIVTLFSKRRLILNVFLVFGLVSLLASFGQATPVRAFLYYVFPLLDMFRHSSFFSYFAVIALIPAAATGISDYLSNSSVYKKKLCWITLAAGLVIIGLLISAIAGIKPEASFFLKPAHNFADWLQEPGRNEHIIIHALIQLIILAVFFVSVLKRPVGSFKALALIIAIEMLISVQLNTYYTVVSAGVNPLVLKHNLDQRAQGFPIPQPGIPVGVNTEINASYSVIWQNANIFNKTVSFEGYNSFRLKGYESLADSFPQLAKSICRNEILYLSDRIEPFGKYNLRIADSIKHVLFTDDPDIDGKYQNLKLTPGDSLRITGFRPGYVLAEISCSDSVAVTLLQEWYPGWKVKVDGAIQPAFVTNKMAISTIIPSGKHIVEYSYFNRPVFFAFFISYITVLVLISLLIFFQVKNRNRTFRISAILLLWITVCSLSYYRFGYTSYDEQKLAQYRDVASSIVKSGVSAVVCNVDDREMMQYMFKETGYQGKSHFVNLTYPAGLSGLIQSIDSIRDKKIAKVDLIAASPEEAEAALRIKWPVVTDSYSYKSGSLRFYSMGLDRPGFSKTNDFESSNDNWKGDTATIDSVNFFEGKFSNRVDSIFIGSHVYKWKPGAEDNHKPFDLLVKAKLAGDFSGASLIITQRRDKLIIRSFSVNLRTYQNATSPWSNVVKYGSFPKGALEGDEISAFFWGNGKSTFFIDNFHVDLRFVE